MLSTAYAELEPSAYGRWQIGATTIEEARSISIIKGIAKGVPQKPQPALLQMREAYEESKSSFLRFVILEELTQLGELSSLDGLNDPVLDFARIQKEDEAEAQQYIGTVNSPIIQSRLQFWLARQHEGGVVPDSQDHRLAVERKSLEESMAKLDSQEKVQFLFGVLSNWKSPLQYEACFTLLQPLHVKESDLVLSSLREFLYKVKLPAESPPPYTRAHTDFTVACQLAMILGDARLLPDLRIRVSSPSEFEQAASAQAVEWLESGIPYPWEYENAARIFKTEG